MDTDPLFLPKSGNLRVASSVANVPVDADAIERAPGVDTLLEGIQANSQELPAFRKDAFQKEALRHARKAAADASARRMERTAPAVLLAPSEASKTAKKETSNTAATVDAETPSSPKLAETAPGSRQKRERHVLVALAVICALLAGGAVFGGLSMLRGHPAEAEPRVTAARSEAPNGVSLTPHADMLVRGSDETSGAAASEERSGAATSEEALAALRAEAEAQLAEASTIGEGSAEAAPQRASMSVVPASDSHAVRRASRVESTRGLSTVPPRSDISRSQ